MTKILALLDGSVYAQSVCDYAGWAASRIKADVELLHLLGRRGTPGALDDLSGNIGLGARTALLEELAELDAQRAKLALKRGRAILEDAEKRLKTAGVTGVSSKLRNMDLVEAVNELEEDAELVVIGKRGEAADFAKLHLGSNLERVLRSSRRPVLVASRAFRPVENVLIAFDGGRSAMKAVDHIARDPLFQGLSCSLVMAGSENSEHRRKMADAEAVLKAGGIEVHGEFIPGNPETVIHDKVAADGIDLLVMGAYGHSRIRSFIIGSTTSEMIRSVTIPVMLFR
ncbi:universal stress protein [Cucumibacter marinus]|uniref:universal stress protein n=1 Tax=Cucumibacter marinus TaxID=1121252 RepID=UPI00042054A5|nr:universal stress protein [Cucumibacter marinus]